MNLEELKTFVASAQGNTNRICEISDHLGAMIRRYNADELKQVEAILTPTATKHQNHEIRRRVEVMIRVVAGVREDIERENLEAKQ